MVLDEVEMARVIARRLLELGSLKPLAGKRYLSRVDKAFSSSLAEIVRMCRR